METQGQGCSLRGAKTRDIAVMRWNTNTTMLGEYHCIRLDSILHTKRWHAKSPEVKLDGSFFWIFTDAAVCVPIIASRLSEDIFRSVSSSGVSSKVSGATLQPESRKKLHSPSRRNTNAPSPMTLGATS